MHASGIAALALALAGAGAAGPEGGDASAAARTAQPAGVFDHHVHLIGPQLVADWKAVGARFSRPDAFYHSVETWFEEPLDGERDARPTPAFAGALLVPMAHLYGNAELRLGLELSLAEEARRVRVENEHVAAEARKYPERTRALAAVDLLRPYALAELAHMRREHAVAGAKVHLGSAGFDVRDEAHLAALARVATWCAEEDVLLLLHLDPQRRGATRDDMRHLLEVTLGPHPDLAVIVPHLGGSGGFGPWTQSVLAAASDWLAAERARGAPRAGVLFDLSAVPMIRESEGVPPSSAEEIAALAPALRALGLERVLFGSDFPVFDPREHAAFLDARCGLTADELAAILANRALD
jgi:predicted TIM-barrel fold metal-dependent hydrolase